MMVDRFAVLLSDDLRSKATLLKGIWQRLCNGSGWSTLASGGLMEDLSLLIPNTTLTTLNSNNFEKLLHRLVQNLKGFSK